MSVNHDCPNPNCNNDGIIRGRSGDVEQCEWCWENPDSVFNTKQCTDNIAKWKPISETGLGKSEINFDYVKILESKLEIANNRLWKARKIMRGVIQEVENHEPFSLHFDFKFVDECDKFLKEER